MGTVLVFGVIWALCIAVVLAFFAGVSRGSRDPEYTSEQAPFGVCPDCGYPLGSADARPCSEVFGPGGLA